MYKLHCDLCDRDLSKDANVTTILWKDNEGYDYEFGHIFRKPRKFKVDICDKCLEFLKQKGHYE